MAKQRLITKQKAIEDIWYLKEALEEIHPNLYFNLTEEEFSTKLKGLINMLPEELVSDSLSLLISPVLSELCDGHTRVWNSDKKIFIPAKSYFPLQVDLTTYIVCNDNQSGVEKGARLMSINNIKIEELVKTILPQVPGEKKYFKIAQLEYELPIYLWELKKFEGSFDVSYSYGGEVFHKTIEGGSSKTFFRHYEGVEGEFSIKELEDGRYGYLKLSMFGYSKEYYKFFENCFKEMNEKKVDKLIIDIRDNPGGNTNVSSHLLQYIAKKPYELYQSVSVKYSKTGRSFYRNYGLKKTYLYPFVMMSSMGWKAHGTAVQNSFSQELNIDEDKRYKGKVYLITSNYCFSTADDFARVFKYYKMGVVVGEETGGMKDSYGDCILFKLPNSKIQCACSSKYYKGLDLNDNPSDGVMPDYKVNCKYYTEEEVTRYIHDLRNK